MRNLTTENLTRRNAAGQRSGVRNPKRRWLFLQMD
jgi:hypothetical protein